MYYFILLDWENLNKAGSKTGGAASRHFLARDGLRRHNLLQPCCQ